MSYKRRRSMTVMLLVLLYLVLHIYQTYMLGNNTSIPKPSGSTSYVVSTVNSELAQEALSKLEIKGRAPKNGYQRTQFGDGWQQIGQCDTRNHILARDMSSVKYKSADNCDVVSGILNDPYTGEIISFVSGINSSDKVQIDHVVALSDAWQKGAQNLSSRERILFANDGLNLLAVDGQTNQDKSSSDSASWLPPNKTYRCQYVARQIAVKQKYHLWVTIAEHTAMKKVLESCANQRLPQVTT